MNCKHIFDEHNICFECDMKKSLIPELIGNSMIPTLLRCIKLIEREELEKAIQELTKLIDKILSESGQ